MKGIVGAQNDAPVLKRTLRRTVGALCATAAMSVALAAPAFATCGPVALDPGHGGTEAGASGNGLREEVLNWKVANYCKERLDQLGIPNFLTKQNYETLSRFERNQRAEAKNARALVSFHFNSGGGRGAEVLVTNASTWNRFTNTESSAFGRDVLSRLNSLGLANRGLKVNNWSGKAYPDGSLADSMGINYYPRLNGTTGLIIEHGFIDNFADASKFKSEAFLKQLGYADAEVIARQWPNSYTKPAASKAPSATKNGWYSENGNWYYYQNGKKATGWLTERGQRYYLDPSTGARRTGWITVDGKRYFMRIVSTYGPVGSMAKGWLVDGGHRYFLDRSSGAMALGWVSDGGHTYFLRKAANAWGPAGSMATGWTDDGGKRYFLRRADNAWGPAGSRAFGWTDDGGQRYFLDRKTGAMALGWLTDGGQTYFLRKAANQWGPAGSMATGWTDDGGKRYFLRRSDNQWGPRGSRAFGWLEDGGNRYFLDRITCAAKAGWLTEGGKRYYFDPATYAARKGTCTIDGKTYVFDNSCALVSEQVKTGWQTESGQRCYYYGNGQKAYGWADISGARYFFNRTSGAMRTGWLDDADQRYYLDPSSGAMAKGWVSVGGKRYFMRTVSTWGPVGSMARGWLSDGGKRYFLDRSSGAAATGVHVVDGKVCNFASDGVLVSDGPLNAWYDSSWRPSSSTVPGSKVHFFDASGKEAYTRTTNTAVMGSSSMGKDAFVKAFAAKIQGNYPQIYRSDVKYGATTPEAFATATWNAAASEGVRPEVLAAQIGNETGWLRFGGIVNANQCNFGGLGALDGNANGNAATFKNVQEGLLAQAQHLKAYSSKAALSQACVDPRFHLVNRGVAPYLEDYGADGHGGLVWASNRLYGRDLLSAMRSITG